VLRLYDPQIYQTYALGGFTNRRIIKHRYLGLFYNPWPRRQTYVQILSIIEVGSGGSGVARSTASTKSRLAGETRNGLHPCGLWPTVWATVTAAP